MSNLTELCGKARLPVFERLAQGHRIANKSIYDLTTSEVREEIKKVMAKQREYLAQGKKTSELNKTLEALHQVLRSRGELVTGGAGILGPNAGPGGTTGESARVMNTPMRQVSSFEELTSPEIRDEIKRTNIHISALTPSNPNYTSLLQTYRNRREKLQMVLYSRGER